jgi:hypothetical protein
MKTITELSKEICKKLIRFYLAMRWHRRRNAAFKTVRPKALEFWNEQRTVFFKNKEDKEKDPLREEPFEVSCYQNLHLIELHKQHLRL